MKKYLLIFLCGCSVAFQGCNNVISPTVVVGKDIDDKIMLEINDLDMKIFSALKLNNYSELSEFLSEGLKREAGWKMKMEVMPRISSYIIDKSYAVGKDYYAKSLLPNNQIVVNEGEGDWRYTLRFTSTTRETYISTLKLSNTYTTFLLTLFYGKYDNKWKLTAFQVGQHSYQNKTAPTLYHMAQKLDGQGDLLDATCIMSLAASCAHPADKYFTYAIDSQMTQYRAHLSAKAQKMYPLPYPLTNLQNGPSLYNCQSKITEDGTYLIVNYITQINLSDSVALKNELQVVKKNLPWVFPGIEKNNNMFAFNAINDTPKNENDEVHYHMFEFSKEDLQAVRIAP